MYLGVLLTGCEMHESGVTVQTLMDREGPTSESWNAEMNIFEDGRPRIILKASYLAKYDTPDSSYTILTSLVENQDRVRVDIFDAEGDSSAVVHANRITFFDREHRFVAEGNVIVQAADDRWLFAEHLQWSEHTARVTTPGFSTVKTPKQTLSGYMLDADENLLDIGMARVTGTIETEDE